MNKILPLIGFSVMFLVLFGSQTALGQTISYTSQQSDVSVSANSTPDQLVNAALQIDCISPVAATVNLNNINGDTAIAEAQVECNLNPNFFFVQGSASVGGVSNSPGQGTQQEAESIFQVEFELTEIATFQLLGFLVNSASSTGGGNVDGTAQVIFFDIDNNVEIFNEILPPGEGYFDTGLLNPGNYRVSVTASASSSTNSPGTTAFSLSIFSSTFNILPAENEIIGGEIIPIETTSLLLAGAQTFSWMIPVILSGIGIGLFVASRKFENS